MPSGVYKHKKGFKLSEEHKAKIRETQKNKGIVPPKRNGVSPWNKGLKNWNPNSKEIGRKISKALKGHKVSSDCNR